MKCTAYFLYTRTRPDRSVIGDEWIERTIRQPQRQVIQTDGRIRRWVRIPEWAIARVILMEDGKTVHNA